MDQVLRFLGILVMCIAAGLEFVGFLAVAITEGWAEVAAIFVDPINIAFLLAFYIPGAALYGIGVWTKEPAPQPEAGAAEEIPSTNEEKA